MKYTYYLYKHIQTLLVGAVVHSVKFCLQIDSVCRVYDDYMNLHKGPCLEETEIWVHVPLQSIICSQ